MNTLDIAWIAGLLEGEGSFSYRDGSRNYAPRLDIQMTDEDVVKKCANLWGVKIPEKSWQSKKHPHYKPLWRCTICGRKAAGWMMTVFKFMGKRRKNQIKEALAIWKEPLKQKMATCHTSRIHRAKGLCSACWQKQWRHRTGRNTVYYRKKAMEA